MNYNKYMTPEIPHRLVGYSDKYPDYVYIGTGAPKKHCLSNNWNGGKRFAAYCFSTFSKPTLRLTTGDDANTHYFVHKDAPILSVMFPYDPDYADKEIARLKTENADLKEKISDLEDKLSDVRDAVEGWKEDY